MSAGYRASISSRVEPVLSPGMVIRPRLPDPSTTGTSCTTGVGRRHPSAGRDGATPIDSVFPASESVSPDAAAPHRFGNQSGEGLAVRCSNVAPWVWPWSDSTTSLYGRGVQRVTARCGRLPIEIAQHRERIDALGARVVGDLVVAQQVDVDRSPSFAHVVDDALHGHVARHDGGERPEQRIDPAACRRAARHPRRRCLVAASRSRPISMIAAIRVRIACPGREK